MDLVQILQGTLLLCLLYSRYFRPHHYCPFPPLITLIFPEPHLHGVSPRVSLSFRLPLTCIERHVSLSQTGHGVNTPAILCEQLSLPQEYVRYVRYVSASPIYVTLSHPTHSFATPSNLSRQRPLHSLLGATFHVRPFDSFLHGLDPEMV